MGGNKDKNYEFMCLFACLLHFDVMLFCRQTPNEVKLSDKNLICRNSNREETIVYDVRNFASKVAVAIRSICQSLIEQEEINDVEVMAAGNCNNL